MKKLELCSLVLLVISGILWGLIGLFDYDLLDRWLGTTWLPRFIGFLFGVAGVITAVYWRKRRKA